MLAATTASNVENDILLMQQKAQPIDFQHAVRAIKNGQSLIKSSQALLSQLTNSERLSMLDGDEPFWKGLRKILRDRYNREPFVHGAVPRLGISGIHFTDGPRGVVMGASTAFPVPMARGATWDIDLERRVGVAIGLEAKAQGANFFAGVCINLPRHPAWGRIQETYGEDPILLGNFGVALTEGVQQHIMACAKHFALNSMENARFQVDVQVDEDVLHEVYLPHFRQVVECGVASIMSSYNSVNGEWAGQNRCLLIDILRGLWHFDGFVLSDFIFGLRNAAVSLKNGLDIEAPFMQQREMHLKEAFMSENITQSDVDIACLRILGQQLRFAANTTNATPDPQLVFSNDHRSLAREVAGRSMVLLKNEAVGSRALLPLDVRQISRIAVIGRLANVPNTGDRGSSQVFSPHVASHFQGLREALPNVEVVLEESDSPERAAEVAAQSDVVVCVVGYEAADEGEYVVPSFQTNPELLSLFPEPIKDEEIETFGFVTGSERLPAGSGLEVGAGGDRRSLRLRPQDVSIIKSVAKVNGNTIVSVVAAGAVIMEDWKNHVPAVLMSWYGGCEGGHALADVLLGRIDASGRLPFSIPKDETHLPNFDIDATKIQYDRWFGQHLLDKLGVKASYPFGFGLSYTNFLIVSLDVKPFQSSRGLESLNVQVVVANIGARKGRHVVQVYGLPRIADLPQRLLLGFATVEVEAGERIQVRIIASLRPLQRWVQGRFVMPHKTVTIEVGAFSGDPKALSKQAVLRTF